MSPAEGRGTLRIVQFLPSVGSASGGPVRSTLANCRAAHRAAPEMETLWVSTRHGLEPEWERQLRSELPPQMSLRLFSQWGHHTGNVSAALLRWLWRNLARHHLLVLRALMHPLTSAAGWIARRKRVPYLVVPHGTLSRWTFRHRRRVLKRLYYRLVERRTVEGAAAIRFTSEAERNEARRLGFATEDAVIPHPFAPRSEDCASDQRDPDQILFLSRLDPKKGVGLLLDALVLARERRSSLNLVLAGSGRDDFERDVRRMIRKRRLEQAVDMPGFMTGEEKESLLRGSGVFVLPSEEENFGIAAVEALDAGLPVVITREVDVAPHVEEYEAGVVVDERSPEAVCEGMLSVLEGPGCIEAMGRRGQKLVRDRFAPEVIGPQVAELYRTSARGDQAS